MAKKKLCHGQHCATEIDIWINNTKISLKRDVPIKINGKELPLYKNSTHESKMYEYARVQDYIHIVRFNKDHLILTKDVAIRWNRLNVYIWLFNRDFAGRMTGFLGNWDLDQTNDMQ